jgi:hypothetical protein
VHSNGVLEEVRADVRVVALLQVAIVLFRTLEEFYDAPLKVTTLPLMLWRFATIGVGSLFIGVPLL